MSVSVFVQSIVSAWAIRSCPPCALSVRLDFRCPKTAQNLPPITTQSTSIFYVQQCIIPDVHASRKSRTNVPDRGAKHPRRARPGLDQPCEPTSLMLHAPPAHRSFSILQSNTYRASHEPVSAWPWLSGCNGGNAHVQRSAARAAGTYASAEAVCLSFPCLSRMRMYVSGRYVEQDVHMRVQQFLGWVGIFTRGTAGVFMHASVLSVFGCASCRPDD